MNPDGLFVIGATHQTAPLEIRERLALDPEGESEVAARLGALEEVREFAVLNTCNRVEFYAVASEGAAGRIQEAFCTRQRFDPAEFQKFHLAGTDAVRHLLEVASGLDSQMLGETEIFGQVKEAYAAAQARGSAGPVLNRLFQKAFHAAKHVRTHTAVTSGPVSVVNVAVDLALHVFGRLEGARVLLLGAGEIGEKAARAFRSRGAGSITVSSRSPEHAAQVASQLGASTLPFEERETRLREFDVVACAAAAPAAILSRSAVVSAARKRPARPLLLLDLGLPRNVEPGAANLDSVFLYDLDDLARAADENRAARDAEAARGRAILAERAEGLWRQVEPILASMAVGAPPQLRASSRSA
jgi:glutamyl-tRNA reductase